MRFLLSNFLEGDIIKQNQENNKRGIKKMNVRKEIYSKMDKSIESPEKRLEIVNHILETASPDELNSKLAETLANYILFAMTKEQKRQKNIITPNRQVTVSLRETSYEGLAEKLENGEQGIHNLITNDKNIIFNHTEKITQHDIDTVPNLKEIVETIKNLEKQYEKATGEKRHSLKRQIIQLSKDQYVLKAMFKKNFYFNKITRTNSKKPIGLDLSENIWMDEEGKVKSDNRMSLVNPEGVAAVLKIYDKLVQDVDESLESDSKWMLVELNSFIAEMGEKNPLYEDLIFKKIEGYQNIEIQNFLHKKYGIKHSVEYISSLWKRKIPRLISNMKKEKWLLWYYDQHMDENDWKVCTKCGKEKPRHNVFYAKNKDSKDGLYSICKTCRNNKFNT